MYHHSLDRGHGIAPGAAQRLVRLEIVVDDTEMATHLPEAALGIRIGRGTGGGIQGDTARRSWGLGSLGVIAGERRPALSGVVIGVADEAALEAEAELAPELGGADRGERGCQLAAGLGRRGERGRELCFGHRRVLANSVEMPRSMPRARADFHRRARFRARPSPTSSPFRLWPENILGCVTDAVRFAIVGAISIRRTPMTDFNVRDVFTLFGGRCGHKWVAESCPALARCAMISMITKRRDQIEQSE